MMLALSRRTVIATSMLAAIGVAVPATLAATSGSQAQPANKAVAAGGHLQVLDPKTPVPVLTASLKTSKPEDLLLNVSFECSIITDVLVNGTGPSTDPNTPATATAEASGAIRAWLTIDGDSNIIPIQDTSAPPQDPSQQAKGGEADKVTFCDRDNKITITDKEQPADGTDQLENYESTKSANAFNWVRLNAGSGDHTIKLWVEFDQPAQDAQGPNSADSTSHGYVGNRTLVIEPTKLANNAVIADTGTN
jgi:hypothetical protein